MGGLYDVAIEYTHLHPQTIRIETQIRKNIKRKIGNAVVFLKIYINQEKKIHIQKSLNNSYLKSYMKKNIILCKCM